MNTENKITPVISTAAYFQPRPNSQLDTSDKVRPLAPNGHLVKECFWKEPFVAVDDFCKDVKNLKKGLDGKLDDNSLGRLNDVGMKLGGLMIAIYLAAKRTVPAKKAMEFVGFGAFFASMSLWPKLMIQKPIELMHGVDVHKKYVDSQNRKKMFFQDPQYVPWDLYSHDEIEKLGDKMKIPKDLKNRQDIIKDTAQRQAIKANTLWMWTAGFATPLMTALSCCAAEPYIASAIEKHSLKKADKELKNIDTSMAKYLDKRAETKLSKYLEEHAGQKISKQTIVDIANAMDVDSKMGQKLKGDLAVFLDSKPGVLNAEETLNGALVDYVVSDNPKRTLGDMLNFQSKNSCVKANIPGAENLTRKEFAQKFCSYVTEKAKQKLESENIREFAADDIRVVRNINNVLKEMGLPKNVSEGLAIMFKTAIGKHAQKVFYPKLTPDKIKKLKEIAKDINLAKARTQVWNNLYKVLLGNCEDSRVARLNARFENACINAMGYSSKEVEDILAGGKKSEQTIFKALDEVIKGEKKSSSGIFGRKRNFSNTMKKLVQCAVDYDKVFNESTIGQLTSQIQDIAQTGAAIVRRHGFTEVADALEGDAINKQLCDLKWRIFKALGLTEEDYFKNIHFKNGTAENMLYTQFEKLANSPEKSQSVVAELKKICTSESGQKGLAGRIVQFVKESFVESQAANPFEGWKSKTYDINKLLAPNINPDDAFFNYWQIDVADKHLGTRSNIYRTIHVLDFEQKAANGTLKKQCIDLIKKEFSGIGEQEIDRLADELIKESRDISLKATINEHTEAFDIFKLHRYDGKRYKVIMKLLYDSDLTPETVAIMNKHDEGLFRRFKNHCQAILEHVGNAIKPFKQDAVTGIPLNTEGNPMKKHLLIGKSHIEQISDAARNYKPTNKWLKIFGSMFAGLVGITLLADAFLVRQKKDYRQTEIKGNI